MTVSPTILNFRLYQGATFSEPQELELDLTGFTARMQIRRDISDADAIFTLTTENGGITLGGLAGTVDIEIAADDTALALDPDGETWVYDLQLIDGDVVQRTYQGTITAVPGVTRT